MKTAKDPRHLERIRIMQILYAWDFHKKKHSEHPVVSQIIGNIKLIDQEIQKAAPEWPLEKINKIDLATLRLAVYELTIDNKNPPKVIVDEAVELGKAYGSGSSASFINGALGKLIENRNIPI